MFQTLIQFNAILVRPNMERVADDFVPARYLEFPSPQTGGHVQLSNKNTSKDDQRWQASL